MGNVAKVSRAPSIGMSLVFHVPCPHNTSRDPRRERKTRVNTRPYLQRSIRHSKHYLFTLWIWRHDQKTMLFSLLSKEANILASLSDRKGKSAGNLFEKICRETSISKRMLLGVLWLHSLLKKQQWNVPCWSQAGQSVSLSFYFFSAYELTFLLFVIDLLSVVPCCVLWYLSVSACAAQSRKYSSLQETLFSPRPLSFKGQVINLPLSAPCLEKYEKRL